MYPDITISKRKPIKNESRISNLESDALIRSISVTNKIILNKAKNKIAAR